MYLYRNNFIHIAIQWNTDEKKMEKLIIKNILRVKERQLLDDNRVLNNWTKNGKLDTKYTKQITVNLRLFAGWGYPKHEESSYDKPYKLTHHDINFKTHIIS